MYSIACFVVVALIVASGVYIYHDQIDALVQKVRARFKK